jgi:hypothetical protein
VTAEQWLEDVVARQAAAMPRPQWLKAIRALSSCYVERRSAIAGGAPTDSAGKRAAFAGFYAPLHFITIQRVLAALGPAPPVRQVLDLGCGTGVAGAAWALAAGGTPVIRGIDRQAWALTEAGANWRQLGLVGRAERGDMQRVVDELAGARGSARASASTGLIFGWSLNELDSRIATGMLHDLARIATRGAPILVIEPIAGGVAPWWPDAEAAEALGARASEWRFDVALPNALAAAARDAGLSKAELTARTLTWGWT